VRERGRSCHVLPEEFDVDTLDEARRLHELLRQTPERAPCTARALDDLFSVVTVGEFNAGKSAFINALLGQPLLPILGPIVHVFVQLTGAMVTFLRLHPLITQFVAGPGSSTLPMVIFSKVRFGVTPDVNALATIMVLLVASGIAVSAAWMRRRQKLRERDLQLAAAANL